MITNFFRSDSGIGIPYPPQDRRDGGRNHGYFDLKRDPAVTDSVPELQDAPELKSLVLELNNPRSLFRSLSCEKSMGTFQGQSFRYKLTSFVRICFEILAWNREANYQRMILEFEESNGPVAVLLSDFVGIEIETHPASFRDHGTDGWAATIWNHGCGDTEAAARTNWAMGVRLVQRFFSQQRIRYQRELDKGATTVS